MKFSPSILGAKHSPIFSSTPSHNYFSEGDFRTIPMVQGDFRTIPIGVITLPI